MKKLFQLTCLFGFLLTTAGMYSQSVCRTPEYDLKRQENLQRLMQDKSSMNSYCLKIYVHIVRNSSGGGGQPINKVNAAINQMKADFLNHGISFNWDNAVDYINNSTYFNNPSDAIFAVNSHTDGIDLYFFPDNASENFGQASLNTEETALLLSGTYDKRAPFPPYIDTSVLSHEMGHILDLLHTHAGCTGGNYTPANNTNCSTNGDLVCDTPPDPGMDFWVDSPECEWLEQTFCSPHLTYAEILEYNPDEANIMAYTHPNCMQYFTSGQGQRMRDAISSIPLLIEATDPCTSVNCRLGGITVNDFFVNCPELPLVITGTFDLPENGIIVSLSMSLQQGSNIISSFILADIDYVSSTYSFTINDYNVFGSNPPVGNFEVNTSLVIGNVNGFECRAKKATTSFSPTPAIKFEDCENVDPCDSLSNYSIDGYILSWPDIGATVYYVDIMPNSLCCNLNDGSTYGPMTTVAVSTNQYDLGTIPDKCSMIRISTRVCPPTDWCCIKPAANTYIFPYPDTCVPPESSGSNNTIAISPNPATDEFQIIVNSERIASLEFYDIHGLKLVTRSNLHGFTHTLDVSQYKPGTYFVKVVFEDGYAQVKSLVVK